MAFANINSIVADDVNNMLRGINKEQSSNSHTGDTNETDLSTFTLTGGTLTSTGGVHILASGTTTGTAGTKDIKLYFGSALLPTLQVPQANTDDWLLEAWVFNSSTTTQRYISRMSRAASTGAAITATGNLLGSGTKDTAANVTIKVTATLGNSGDTVTQQMFDIFIVQIT